MGGPTKGRLFAALMLTTSLPSGAFAQASNPDSRPPSDQPAEPVTDGVADIVVTAQRRQESVQDVPIAISAFTAEELEQRNVVEALDVLAYVPNVVAHNNVGLGSANSYFIRGLGSTDSIATADPAVGTYVDDIYLARQSANNVSLFDVERVEVLRGPQGTLFGRNTTGGAVNIILARPARTFGGLVEAGVGSVRRRAIRGTVDLPASEAIGFKLSAYSNRDRGYVRNTTTGERLNGHQDYGARAAAEIRLGDVRWNVSGLYTRNRAANILNFECDPRNPSNCDGRFATTGLLRDNGGANQLAPIVVANGKGNLPLGADTKLRLASSNLQVELGGVRIAAITGFVRVGQDYLVDFFDGRAAPSLSFGLDTATGLPTRNNVVTNVVLDPPVRGFRAGGFVIANIARSQQFTQELKVDGDLFSGRIDYVAGLFYFRERSTTDFSDTLTSAATGVTLLLADRIVRNKTRAVAGYAQVDFNVTEQVKLTAGARYTDERRSTAFSDNRAICQVTPLPANCLDSRNFASVDVDLNPATPNVTLPLTQRVRIWTPRFAINYQPSSDVLLFASATRGFKSGAQAARATAVRQLLPVGPEKVWSYELGAKTDLLNRKLRVNLTAFSQVNRDFQAGTAFVNPATGALSFVTRNLADLRNRGLELEVTAKPVQRFTLTLAGGLQNIRYGIPKDKPPVDSFGFLSPLAQQAECRAALAGLASPLGFAGTVVARAQGNCSGIVTNRGEFAKPVRSPDLSLAFTAGYEIPLGVAGLSITPAASILYTSDQEVGTNNLSGYRSASGVANIAGNGDFVLGSFAKAHTLLNLNLRLAPQNDRWAAILSCNNCTDITTNTSTLSNYSYLNEPRSVAFDVRFRF